MGNSNFTLSFIQNLYLNNLSQIITSKDPSIRPQNPIINYYADAYNQLISYAVLFPYPPSIYVVYEILQLTTNNTFYYVGKSFLPSLPQVYWQLQPVNSA